MVSTEIPIHDYIPGPQNYNIGLKGIRVEDLGV